MNPKHADTVIQKRMGFPGHRTETEGEKDEGLVVCMHVRHSVSLFSVWFWTISHTQGRRWTSTCFSIVGLGEKRRTWIMMMHYSCSQSFGIFTEWAFDKQC